MKIDIDTVASVAQEAIKDKDVVNELLEALVRAQKEKNESTAAITPPKKDVTWEWVVYELNGSFWVLQVGADKCKEIDAIIEQTRCDFNSTKKGARYPIERGSVADCFESIPAKFWKKYDVRVKSKTQAFPYISKQ